MQIGLRYCLPLSPQVREHFVVEKGKEKLKIEKAQTLKYSQQKGREKNDRNFDSAPDGFKEFSRSD